MKTKVIIGVWLMGLAAIAWSCGNRQGGSHSALWPETPAVRGEA